MNSRVPVDPDLSRLLDEAVDQLESDSDAPVDRQRASWRTNAAWMRGATDPTLVDVPTRDELIAGIPVRWYGSEPGEPRDIVLYVHGGGWMLGDVDAYDPDVRLLSRRLGRTVVAIDYRRTPEHPFPAALDDCLAVLRKLADRAHRTLAIAGDSAGAHLALASAVALTDEVTIDGILALYPVVDPDALGNVSFTENGAGYLLTTEAMRLYWSTYAASGVDLDDPRCNLPLASLDGFPPTVLVAAGYDPLRDEARDLAGRLATADVDLTYLPQPELTHGFQQMVPRIPAAARALAAAYDAFGSAIDRGADRRATRFAPVAARTTL